MSEVTLAPERDGWFVLDVREARRSDGDPGKYCSFESEDARFQQSGTNP